MKLQEWIETMNFKEIKNIAITEQEIKIAIYKSQSSYFIDNLRTRHPNVSFDSKIRGFIGEIALKKWFKSNGIIINGDGLNHMVDDNVDIDVLYKGLNIEMKTSLIPDSDKTIKKVFENRDIKLIRREKTIEELRGDIHIQLYFGHLRKKKDDWLSLQNVDLKSSNLDYIYDGLLCRSYLDKTYLFGWIDKDTLCKRINSISQYNKRVWSFPNSKKSFWRCPLKDSFPMDDLLVYLENA